MKSNSKDLECEELYKNRVNYVHESYFQILYKGNLIYSQIITVKLFSKEYSRSFYCKKNIILVKKSLH